jgi:hypothetical protein
MDDLNIIGWTPYERLNWYNNIAVDYVKDLLNLFYVNGETFANANQKHPLEPYITALDLYSLNGEMLRDNAARVGIQLYKSYETPEDVVIDFINNIKEFSTISDDNYDEIERIINMTESEFINYTSLLKIKVNTNDYYNRLMIIYRNKNE